MIKQEIDLPRNIKKSSKVYTETTLINTLNVNYLEFYIGLFIEVKKIFLTRNDKLSFISKAVMNDGSIFMMHKVYTMDNETSLKQ
jgi:hypothetical protein